MITETKTTQCHPKPAVNATCLLGEKGCYKNGKCHYIGNCEHKVLTNADRIRAMSDEELAKNLYRFCDLEEWVDYCKNLSECEKLLATEDGIPEQRCICCLLEWLKQPAEE